MTMNCDKRSGMLRGPEPGHKLQQHCTAAKPTRTQHGWPGKLFWDSLAFPAGQRCRVPLGCDTSPVLAPTCLVP